MRRRWRRFDLVEVDGLVAGEDIDLPGDPSRGCTIKWREGNEPDYWGRV